MSRGMADGGAPARETVVVLPVVGLAVELDFVF